MRKFLLIGLLVAIMAFAGCAKEAEATSIDDIPCDHVIGQILNRCHVVEVEERDNPVGAGIDIPLWKNKKVIVDQETKYDGRNDEWSTFTVVKPQMEKGIFQMIGEFFANLFNKGE